MTYQFKLDIFEGPLDLLLHLIKEQKMDIYDIPIAKITKQYLEYIDLLKDLNLEIAGEYLLMAAELTRIKSKLLLPQVQTDDEDEDGEDPRAALVRRLMEYRRFKNAAFELRQKEHDRQQMFFRQSEFVFEEEGDDTLVDATVFDLFSAFKKILEENSFRKDYEVKITTLSVAERLRIVLDMLNARQSLIFESLFEELQTKDELIVTFLSLLELIRMSLIRIQQLGVNEPIRVILTSDKETQEKVLQGFHEVEPGLIVDSDSVQEEKSA